MLLRDEVQHDPPRCAEQLAQVRSVLGGPEVSVTCGTCHGDGGTLPVEEVHEPDPEEEVEYDDEQLWTEAEDDLMQDDQDFTEEDEEDSMEDEAMSE